MSTYKVFIANGTVQNVVAERWSIDWNDGTAVLRFFIKEDTIAVFPPGGWHGVQNMDAYKNMKVAV